MPAAHIALGPAGRDVRRADGATVGRGAGLVDLHLSNEPLAALPSRHRSLARASALRRAVAASLRELAPRIETDPAFAGVAALRARAFGFDIALAGAGNPPRLVALCENLLILALARAFNPASLRRNEMRRERCELWISRDAFIARYGKRPPIALGGAPGRDMAVETNRA